MVDRRAHTTTDRESMKRPSSVCPNKIITRRRPRARERETKEMKTVRGRLSSLSTALSRARPGPGRREVDVEARSVAVMDAGRGSRGGHRRARQSHHHLMDDDDDEAGVDVVEDEDEDEGARGRRRWATRALSRARAMVETLCGEDVVERAGRGMGRGGSGRRGAVEEVYAETCANAVNGTEIERQLSLLEILPTGCDSIDELLGGGLRQGQVIEFTGPSASGKTQLCLSAAASFAALGHRVVYVDTTGGFSAMRVKQFHRGFFTEDADKTEVAQHLKQTLNLIAVHSCHDVFSLLHLLSQLGEEASEDDNNPEHATMGLLVIDSLSSLLSPLLTKAHHQGYTIMATVAAMLRGLAATRKTAVLYTNHTVSAGQDSLADDHGSNLKPALGARWTSVPHRRIRLDKIPGTGWHSASVAYGATAKPAKYRVRSNNIHSDPTA